VSQKIIGLIGGMSWESSAEYYRIINELVRHRLGGRRSARCLMWSFDFGEIEELQHAGRRNDAATAEMIAAAQRLECGGADFVLICTNTMHRMADEVQASSLSDLVVSSPVIRMSLLESRWDARRARRPMQQPARPRGSLPQAPNACRLTWPGAA
jgi:hypothetical protein